jgi:hypothetical protein
MNETARSYRRIRRENPLRTAQAALELARREAWPAWAEGFETSLYTERVSGEVDGHQVVIRTEEDDVQDITWLGSFTDDPIDAVPNPEYERGRYRYFRPDVFMVTSLESLRRHYGRRQAREVYAAQLADLVRTALATQLIVIVEVYDDSGAVTGTATLAGCYVESIAELLWKVDEHGMIAEAIDSANIEKAA